MYSISAKIWLSLVAFLIFLSSCSREGPEPLWEAQSNFGDEYKGGLFPVYIKLNEPVDSKDSISWHTLYARIKERKQGTNSKNQIIADTALLYWVTQPPDKDTIFAIVKVGNNEEESLPIVIDVKNTLPSIKKITGGASRLEDTLLFNPLLTIPANLGSNLKISLELKKIENNLHFIVTMPPLMGGTKYELPENESVFNYEWTVPNIAIDTIQYLKIEDSGGRGERLYGVHLVTYTESGSVWVATEKELVKFSPLGVKVAGVDNFNSISDISVNSNNGKLFVIDEWKNSFSIYDNYGTLLNTITDFKSPSGIAVDVDGKYVWVADAKTSISSSSVASSASSAFEARLRRFTLMSDKLTQTASYENAMYGPVQGLSINQFQSDFVWFAIPKSNKVGFTVEPPTPKYIEPQIEPKYSWNRPSMVSLDPSTGTAWIADSSRIIAIDTSGNILANITGFGFVSSISANKGSVWVSDILDSMVYRIPGLVTGSVAVYGTPSKHKFIAPISVSAYIADGGAWVIDKDAGMAVRLNILGDSIAAGTGLKLPILGKTLQKVE